jgi:hypothetical protein
VWYKHQGRGWDTDLLAIYLSTISMIFRRNVVNDLYSDYSLLVSNSESFGE